MGTNIREDQDWRLLLSFLPENLSELARETGALKRARRVTSGEDLLRLNLVYADDAMSLRQTSAWARDTGIADISDVALLKRLRASTLFLRRIVAELLGKVRTSELPLRVVLLDATSLSRQRTKRTDYRVHMTYDLEHSCVSGIELTDASQGERITRAVAGLGDLVVADRGYPGRQALSELCESGAHALIRIHPANLPLQTPNGDKISGLELAEKLEYGQILDVEVETIPTRSAPAVRGRLIAIRKTDEQVAREYPKLLRKAYKHDHVLGEDALGSSRFVFLFCTLEKGRADGALLLDVYRLRWQVEMCFKRLKGILSLGEVAAKDFDLCEAKILSKLIFLLLIQACESAFFPWGYPLREPQSVALASG